MIRVGIREMRDAFSSFIDRVRKGEHIILTDRGRDLAVIRPVRSDESDEAWLERLEAEGIVEATGRWEPLEPRTPVKIGGKSLSQIVIEERRSGW